MSKTTEYELEVISADFGIEFVDGTKTTLTITPKIKYEYWRLDTNIKCPYYCREAERILESRIEEGVAHEGINYSTIKTYIKRCNRSTFRKILRHDKRHWWGEKYYEWELLDE